MTKTDTTYVTTKGNLGLRVPAPRTAFFFFQYHLHFFQSTFFNQTVQMITLLFFITIQTVFGISLYLVTPASFSSFNELMNPNLKYNKLIINIYKKPAAITFQSSHEYREVTFLQTWNKVQFGLIVNPCVKTS